MRIAYWTSRLMRVSLAADAFACYTRALEAYAEAAQRPTTLLIINTQYVNAM